MQAAKILWGEGLFLRPQHFQRQDAYHEQRLQRACSALHPYFWGLRSLRIDHDSLSHGVLRVIGLSAILPDGERFDAPSHDRLPAPIALSDCAPNAESIEIGLALAPLREHGGNCGVDDSVAQRFQRESRSASDWYSNAPDADIVILAAAAHLVAAHSAGPVESCLPIARVQRESTGGWTIDETFVAPSCSMAGAPFVQLQLRRLLDALAAKVEALQGLHRESAQHIVELRSGDTTSFWLLHAASTAFAELSHLHHHPDLHPERLHQGLLAVAGSLLTFSRAHSLRDLPVYRHAQPGAGFASLFALIRELLETVISTRYFSIALEMIRPSLYGGRLDSNRIDESTALYLGVRSAINPEELVSLVPPRFKIGAPDDVDKFIVSALPGLKLVHAPQVPSAIPLRAGQQYFLIDARSPLYKRMLESQSVNLFAPPGLPELELELLAVNA